MLSTLLVAVEEGIVAGGGTALANVIPAVAALELTGDEATGRNVVLRAPGRTCSSNRPQCRIQKGLSSSIA